MANNNNNNWKRIGGFSRTGTQNYVRTNDAAMGGTTFGSTDVSNNVGNTILRIGNNAGVVYINGDIDMSGGVNVVVPINRIRNVRDPVADQDVATKFYVDKTVDAVITSSVDGVITGPTGREGPPGIGIAGTNGSAGPTGYTGCTGPLGATGSSFGVKGPTGEKGVPGSTGANGAAGATGPIGPVGEKGEQGTEGTQGIQGSNGTILWLNPDGDSPTNQLITDSYLLSKVPINASIRTVGPISVSATYGNVNKIIPASRFFNTAIEVSTLAVIPSGVWVLNLYANVPSTSDANQVALYAAVFMISGTTNQPSPDSLVIETKDGGDAGYYPPRAAYLPDHVKYIGKSWASTENVLNVPSTDTTTNKGVPIDGTSRKLYKLEIPVEFITLKDASGNRENVYVQLQIYIRNTKEANQTANVSLYFQTDATTNETTYSYLQTTFGAVGIQGIPGTTGSTGAKGDNGLIGPAGPAGATGSVGPTGIAGPVGPRGSQGPTGVTGPGGSSNSYGVQYAVQYRGNQSTGDTDNSGNFRGDTNFRYIPTGYVNRLTDATAGSVVLNDLACNSIHSPVYVQDTSIVVGTGTTRPRTYIRGGELVNSGGSAEQSNYVVLASGTDTTNGSNSKTAVSVNDITNGIKMIHNYGTKKVTFQVHDENKASGTVGLQFDLNGSAVLGNVSAAQDQFCIVNSSGAAGMGGITAAQLSSSTYTALNRMLHVRGNIMVGSDPGGVNAASNAGMVLLNKSTTTPSGLLSGYPGVYHRQIASGEVTALGAAANSIAAPGEGLGFISPNFITFQTGSSPPNNSIVINQAGVVSVTGRTNLNGAVTVNKNFGTVETHETLAPVMDISGTLSVSTGAPDFTDVPRIKLISRGVAANSAIPSTTTTSTSNEIRGVSSNSSTSGFLRLSAQTPAHSCIDLIGLNVNQNNTPTAYNNAVRISTGGTERMIVNGSGNVGIGTNAPTAPLEVVGNAIVRSSVRIGSSAAPSTTLDVTGIVRSNTGIKLGNAATASMASDSSFDVETTGTARVRFTSGTNILTIGTHNNTHPTSESFFYNESATRMAFGTSNNRRMTITNTGNVGIGIEAPTSLLHVAGAAKITGDLDVAGAANVSNYLSVGSGGSGSGATTSTLPRLFYVRTGNASNWRDFIPLLLEDSTTNRLGWGLDSQWYDVNNGPANEIAKQFSYFAGYWLNANRAVVGTSFTVFGQDSTGQFSSNFTFTATAVSNGIVTAYSGFLSQGGFGTQQLTPQQDGINAGVARRSLSNPNRTLLMGGSVETGYVHVTGSAKVSTILSAQTGLILGDNTRSAMDVNVDSRTGCLLNLIDTSPSGAAPRMRFIANENSVDIGCHNTETYIWSRGDTNLVIATNGTQRMTITKTGNVGIGIQAPSSLLHVAGTAHVAGAAKITGNLDMSLSGKIVNLVTPTAAEDAATKGYVDGRFVNASISTATIGSTSDGSVVDNSVESKLAIYHATAPKIYISTSSSAEYGLLIGKDPARAYIDNREPTGELAIVTEQNIPIVFKTNVAHVDGGWGINRMVITPEGLVGIGTSNPNAPLHVGTTKSIPTGYTAFYSFAANSGTWTARWSGGGNYNVSIISGGDLWVKGNYIWVSSDKRIKRNIRDIEGTTALSQVRKIRPKLYNYIDNTKGTQDIYGFIAQDTEDVITSSSMIMKDYIPNFYCKGDIATIDQTNHIYEISTQNEFKFEKVLDASGNEITNYKIKLYDEKNKEYICTVIHRIDANTIRVKCDKEYVYSTIEEYKNAVFIYGQEVNDFYNLDKNAIFTVATAALQEVDRQQQADKARIAELENQVSNLAATVGSLESTVASQQSLINDILERLKKLEA